MPDVQLTHLSIDNIMAACRRAGATLYPTGRQIDIVRVGKIALWAFSEDGLRMMGHKADHVDPDLLRLQGEFLIALAEEVS